MANDDFIEGATGPDIFDPKVLDELEALHAAKTVDDTDAAVKMLNRRKEAYARVFTAGTREQADIDIVLCDLMWFCKQWVPTYDIKDGVHAEELSKRKEGRREVFQRIKDFSLLDSDALLLKYTDATTK